MCDCQVRQSVEAVMAFSEGFVHKLQENQQVRYNQIMQAFNMSTALTARRTREFRLPPQEQVHLLKIIKNLLEKRFAILVSIFFTCFVPFYFFLNS